MMTPHMSWAMATSPVLERELLDQLGRQHEVRCLSILPTGEDQPR